MAVRYLRVNPVVDLFAPAVRGTGNLAIVGPVTVPPAPAAGAPPAPPIGAVNTPTLFTDSATALATFPGALGTSIALAFEQNPGPASVVGVRVADAAPDYAASLQTLETSDVQIVALAGVPLNAASAAPTGAISLLAAHVDAVSNTGEDGKERIGVAMLAKGSADPTIVSGGLVSNRMVYIAHKSDQDAAAAVAGTIAGYPPSTSMLLKQVSINTGLFSSADIIALNNTETFDSGPAGRGVNWLTAPVLIPGQGIYMGEGYTGNPGGMKYIDIVRTVDDVTFRLKAQLIKSIGSLRISRAGLRALQAQMESVLDPLVAGEVLDGYAITIPLLLLLDKPTASLTDSELQQINNAHAQRVVEVITTAQYAGAIHRLAITLKFV